MSRQQPVPCNGDCSAKTNSIFRYLTSEEQLQLSTDKGCNIYKRGNIIYREGNKINGFYCINKGIVKIFKTGTEGKEQIIRFAKQGDIIGFRSVLNGETACSTTKVVEDAILCFIPTELLYHFIKTNSDFSLKLLQLVCKELGESNSFLTDIAQKTVRERLAEVLIHLIGIFGLDNEKNIQVSLTREELANMVGTATESVIRLLSEFKSDKLIELNGRKIKVLDISGLNKIGNMYK